MNLMSLRYTTVRLWWDGRRGQAQCDGVEREISVKPDLQIEMYTIDYAPELDTQEIRRRPCDHRDDITAPEVAAIKGWLHCFANAVKRELGMR
jgi:hypothetical protein